MYSGEGGQIADFKFLVEGGCVGAIYGKGVMLEGTILKNKRDEKMMEPNTDPVSFPMFASLKNKK